MLLGVAFDQRPSRLPNVLAPSSERDSTIFELIYVVGWEVSCNYASHVRELSLARYNCLDAKQAEKRGS
jgi:hypothetical protein